MSTSPTDGRPETVPEGLLQVGRITRAHGIRGGVTVVFSSDRPERTNAGTRLFDGKNWLVIASSRRQPPNKWVVFFEGIDDRNRAETFGGKALYAEPLDDPEALWVHQLIGAMVVDAQGLERGRCVAVIDNPANDLLELDTGHLVPVTFVRDNTDGVITVDVPDGLFDLLD